MPQRVVVDTSALISVFEERVNIEEQLSSLMGKVDIIIPSAVLAELSFDKSSNARSASELSKRYTIFECDSRGDDGVVETAVKTDAFAVVTNDSVLADRLVAKGFRVVRMKGRKRFGFYRSDDVQ